MNRDEFHLIETEAPEGYTYAFTFGLEEVVFECNRCGALVIDHKIDRHINFHTLFATVILSPQ